MANNLIQENQAGSKQRCSLLGNPAGFKLFFNERDSDVSIKVEYMGQKWQFPAHKLVLCTMSDVFRSMLEADMLEKHTKIITIKDSSPYVTKQFLRYLYMGTADFIHWKDATSILKIAHKYNVQTLINLCENYLLCNIYFNNVCLLHELSRIYSLDTLENRCREFILEAGFIVSATDGFFELNPRSLEYFISSPYFNVENEGCLLMSLKEWAEFECTRKCVSLTRPNVLEVMKPFLRFIQWSLIPEQFRTYVPKSLVEKIENRSLIRRTIFHTPALLQNHINYVKCSVELGTFYQEDFFHAKSRPCMQFSAETHIFMVGFRIIGLFKKFTGSTAAPNFLNIHRDGSHVFTKLNLASLPWARGATVGNCVWQELVAYLPSPIRLDPFHSYIMSFRSSRRVRSNHCVKWPITRLDTEPISTKLGLINLNSPGPSFGITQIFILPAPPFKNICNQDGDYL